MESLLLLLTASLVLYKSNPHFTTIRIGDTPCSVWFPADASFEERQTESGDALHFSEQRQGHSRFGVICVQLNEGIDYESAQMLLHNYMHDLREPLCADYNTGITELDVDGQPLIALADFWQDKDGIDWEVKGLTNGSVITVLYVKNIARACSEKQERFFNSFSFGA